MWGWLANIFRRWKPVEFDSGKDWLHNLNKFREANGKPPVEADACTAEQCLMHARWMYESGKIKHDGMNRRAWKCKLFGARENIACTQPEPAAAMRTWMYSRGHRNNMLATATVAGYAKFGRCHCMMLGTK
jgi:uncharacterized protein YkwD